MKRIIHAVALPLVSAGTSIAAIVFVILPTLIRIRETPPGLTYYLGGGFLPDYYQYLSWIRSGMSGMVLLTTRLDVLPQTPALMHPFFLLVGWIAAVTHLSPPTALLVTRIVSMVVFLVSVFALIDRVFPEKKFRLLGRVLFFFWCCLWTKTGTEFIQPITWSTNFDVIGKFALSPHHLMGLAAVIGTLLALYPKTGKPNMALLGLLPVLVGLLNPSFLLILFFAVGAQWSVFGIAVGRYLVRRELDREKLVRLLPVHSIVVFFASLPVLVYNEYLFRSVHPWNLMYALMKNFRPPVTFAEYLMALGPLTLLSAVSLFFGNTWTNGIRRSCAVWAFVPVALFPFIGKLIPINESRLFQLYQYVPLVICAVGAVEGISAGISAIRNDRKNRIGLALTGIIALMSVVYALPPLNAAIRSEMTVVPSEYANYMLYATPDAAAAYRYLDTVRDDSPVVAGEYVSQLVAALTPHRVLIGRDDNAVDYYARRAEVFDFVNGKMSREQLVAFVAKYHPRYVLSGIDTYQMEYLPYPKMDGVIKEVERSGSVSVWKFSDGLTSSSGGK